MNRRGFLSAVGITVVPLTGCLRPNRGDAVVNTAERSAADDAEVIVSSDLPEPQRQIAHTAVEDGFSHACPDLPDALYSFSEQFSTINNSYLKSQGTTYGLVIRIGDTIQVDTAPTPDSDPSCGIL